MKQLLELINAQGGELYAVGGSVRDELLGIPSKDQDLLVRGIDINPLCESLKSLGTYKKVGKSFGVIKFRPHKSEQEIDIALPRKEQSTGQGHRDFEVDFDAQLPVEVDLARRDFSINAMAKNLLTQEIIDPFGGQEDLKKRLLKVVFEEAFEEDPLRMLRAVQFAARFNLEIEENTAELIRKHSELIKTVSSERIVEEVHKLFYAQKPSIGFDLMRDLKLLGHLFPEIEKTIGSLQPKRHGGDVYQHTMRVLDAARSHEHLDDAGNLEIMFAALFHDVGKPKTRRYHPETEKTTFYGHQNVSARMTRKWFKKYPVQMLGINPDNVLNLVQNHMFETRHYYGDKAIRRFIQKVGKENILKLVDLRIADKKGGANPESVGGVFKLRAAITEELNRKIPLAPKDLKINGRDLMKLGFKEGPSLGTVLISMVDYVIEDPERNTFETLKIYALENFQSLL